MRRLVRAAAGSLLLAAAAGGAGCALELMPQGAAPASSPRHGGGDTWASEPSSRWTISIKPDTGEEEGGAATAAQPAPVETAAAIPPAVPVRSEPLAPAPAAQPEIHVASLAETDAEAAETSPTTDGDVSRVPVLEVPPVERTSTAELPTYVSSRATAAPSAELAADERDGSLVAAAPSAPAPSVTTPGRATASARAPYVIEPPRRGGGEPRDPADAASDELLDPEYRIGVEDLLDVSLLGEPELQHVTMRVSPRGTVDFPFAGTLTAAGLSVDEFRDTLLEKLDDYYVAPQVTVFLREYRSRMVHILGEVPRPGPFKLTHRNTLMEVLSRAGGFTPLANKGDVQIIRSDSAGKRIIRVDVNEIIDDGRIDLDIPLESGDVINVPERLF
ncbi:MAG: polysaccharide biosynthesis/export family protein [Deltaproteobacteria bacterium]|nr:polysaccharide biosynthesis/export family protein [Deltaproteobacteria bacterium]